VPGARLVFIYHTSPREEREKEGNVIGEFSPLYHRVATTIDPKNLQLTRGSWVYFSPAWPHTWDWATGKLFEVNEEPIIVEMPVSKILPVNDYKDIDLSNSTDGEDLYPENEGVIYEAFLGMKPGDYITQFYVPANKYIYHLGESSMFPDVTDADKRYLGAKNPSDSPWDTPTIALYFIKDGPPFYLRPYVDAGTFEVCSFILRINKCKLTQLMPPDRTDPVGNRAYQEKKAKARRIGYYSELVGF
jgi:hypothetical protein